MSDISEEDMKYLAENADRIVPYIPPGYFARINAEAKADRERKKEEEEEEKNKKKNAEEKNDEGENDEEKNDEEEDNENWEDYDEEGNEKNEGWGGYSNEDLPTIPFTIIPGRIFAPIVTPEIIRRHRATAHAERERKEKQQEEERKKNAAQQQQNVEPEKAEEHTKQLSSKPAPQRKPRTNLSLLKPIPVFPGYKNPELRIKEDWTLPVDQVDWKALHYREVMRSREMGEWHRSQYKLAVKDCKKAWKKASRRLKEGHGVVMTEVVQQPDQLET
ncbi:hypothetical protein K4K49_007331 [Colletotrichum sp. SAR 10_70]|nr:hypothetical protein K4K50_009377 [Colletotrichum sp. SAR 10_71]KAI8196088.1 hypothetical protein K4K49_007331 [Colletotrichum sp. SAR 10_70]